MARIKRELDFIVREGSQRGRTNFDHSPNPWKSIGL
jgi:hypothetical protein